MRRLTHGHARHRTSKFSPEYNAWRDMKRRCNHPSHPQYIHYGERGIRVCDEWNCRHGFESFLAHIGTRPSGKHSLDRINNDGNYEPGNVRWALGETQHGNTRATRRVTVDGETMSIAQLARKYGMAERTVHSRIVKLGMSAKDAVTTPVRPWSRFKKKVAA